MRTIASLRPFPMRVGNSVGNTIEKAAVLPISIPPRKKYLVYSLFTRGEGAPVRTLGWMRGRFGTQPFFVEKRRSIGCRLNEVFLLLRWATRSPPHPSPSVTASPQGEASGLCSPTRKSVPNQGTQMGNEIAPPPEQCATTAKTSECQRAAPNPGGRGPSPATLCVRAFSRECLNPRPGPGGEPRRRAHPAAVPTVPPIDDRGPPERSVLWEREETSSAPWPCA